MGLTRSLAMDSSEGSQQYSIMLGPRQLRAAWFLGATLVFQAADTTPHPMPKETSLQEGEREEEGAQEGSEGLGPSSLGPPESRDGVLMSASPGPFAGRGLCPSALAHGQVQGDRHRCRHGNTGALIFKKSQWPVRPGADGCS